MSGIETHLTTQRAVDLALDRLRMYTTDPDEDGHVLWTGPARGGSSGPRIRSGAGHLSPSHIAYWTRTGRAPVGIVKAHCGTAGCLAPRHLSDENDRRDLRMQLRVWQGLEARPWQVCGAGLHDWDTYGRIRNDLSSDCQGCNAIAARRARAKRSP